MLSALHHDYERLCEEYEREPEERVIDALKRACVGGDTSGGPGLILSLDEVALTSKMSFIVGELLSTVPVLNSLSVADCAIDDTGVQNLLQGLRKGCCRQLNLQGNNIRGAAVEKLGAFLRENQHIECLLLEWNSVGICERSFSVFCEGLGTNDSLKFLDLRNNQISHDGAKELSTALRRNRSLKKLDMRWNNAGIIGGRHLLSAFEANEVLAKLSVVGNNIPNETVDAISLACSHNLERCHMADEYQDRERTLTHAVHSIKKESNLKISDLMDSLEETEKRNSRETRKASGHIHKLQDTLDERKAALHSTVLKLSMAQSEAVIAQQRIEELESTIAGLTANYQQLNEDFNREKKKNAVIGDLERKYHQQKQEISNLENQLLDMKVTQQLLESKTTETLKAKDQEMAHALQKADATRQKQLSQLRLEHTDGEAALKEALQQTQQTLVNLQVEMSALTKTVVLEKSKLSEDYSLYKTNLISEQNQRVRLLEDQLQTVQANKEQLSSSQRELLASQTELKAANSTLKRSDKRLQDKIDALHKQLAEKDQEVMTVEVRLQEQIKQKANEAEDERRSTAQVRLQLQSANKTAKDNEFRHQQEIGRKDQEIMEANQRRSVAEAQLHGLIQESTQRATALQTAVMTFAKPYSMGSP